MKMLLARNSPMGCKGGNTYDVLSPYKNPTSILKKRKKKSERVKMRMIKNAN